MRLTTRQEEVMKVLRQPQTYLYAHRGRYVWSGNRSYHRDIARQTLISLRKKGLLKYVRHPDFGTQRHLPGMPACVWVAKPPEAGK